jgi:membrane dipeptidase
LPPSATARSRWCLAGRIARRSKKEYGNDWRDHKPPLTNLRAFYELGLRVAGLQYNMANQFGGGCLDPTVPLTIQGKYLVAQMQELGILVDCGGHIGEQTSLGILEMARRPVVCTHSNVLALNDNPRNTSDRVIEGIAKTGGVFGVTAMDGFLTWSRKDAPEAMTGPFPPRAGVPRYVDEFDYLKRLVGVGLLGVAAFGFVLLTCNPNRYAGHWRASSGAVRGTSRT